MMKNMAIYIVLLGIFLLAIFYYAILWFHKNPEWQDRNVIFARKVLGKGFKVALNGIDWNQNKISECIAFMPVKEKQKIAPHLQAIHQLVVIEKDSVLFFWKSQHDTLAFIPIINSLDSLQIPIIFSHRLDSINTKSTHHLVFSKRYQIVQK